MFPEYVQCAKLHINIFFMIYYFYGKMLNLQVSGAFIFLGTSAYLYVYMHRQLGALNLTF